MVSTNGTYNSSIYVDPLQSPRKKDKNAIEALGGFNRVYRIGRWIHRSGYYHLMRPRLAILQKFYGHFFGKFLNRPNSRKNVLLGLKYLLPNLSSAAHRKLADAYFAYMAELMIDMMFNIPICQEQNVTKFIHATGEHYLEAALAQGKGVLIPALHVGQFFHVLAYCAFLKKADGTPKYEYVVVATLENLCMFSTMISKTTNVWGIVTQNFADMKEKIAHHLKKNRIVMLFYDFTKITHLQTQFDDTSHENSFMMPTPQSIVALHKETGAPIVPALSLPKEYLGKSEAYFFDSAPFSKISEQYENSSDKEYHGQISLAINRVLHPYIRRYAHLWEELMAFGIWLRLKKVRFEANISIENFTKTIFLKVQDLLLLSYEPERDEIKVTQKIQDLKLRILKSLHQPYNTLYSHKSKFRYGAISIHKEIMGLFSLLHKELVRNHEDDAAELLIPYLTLPLY